MIFQRLDGSGQPHLLTLEIVIARKSSSLTSISRRFIVLPSTKFGSLTGNQDGFQSVVLCVFACRFAPASSRDVQCWRERRLAVRTDHEGKTGRHQTSVSLLLQDWMDFAPKWAGQCNFVAFENACRELQELMKMFRYPRKDWAVTSGMASMDELAKTAVRSGDCHLVAHIAACGDFSISFATLWRSYTYFIIVMPEMITHEERNLGPDRHRIHRLRHRLTNMCISRRSESNATIDQSHGSAVSLVR
ncbi:uncharacterized protein EKO05_0006440 [Ascochyta rabiei]|uniref:uncharacterized protein n=1 Tax=Didymella rabiei TaxID=5454 RepID=UPI0022012A21|nr:uncharacterized protein EKO05_0006440 [Ascochyta rabiei]UPX16015.1 hypothetical protein EKO05_0006440 [Ascochyta rabiei]